MGHMWGQHRRLTKDQGVWRALPGDLHSSRAGGGLGGMGHTWGQHRRLTKDQGVWRALPGDLHSSWAGGE